MNITIFSGGHGSIALQNGLKEIYPHCRITNIVNLYDDGKSTRIARRVCDCLGPSDLRKNHLTQYLYNTEKSKINQNIIDFYDKRFDISSDYDEAIEFVLNQLNIWGFEGFDGYVKRFFENAKKKGITNFKDFAITNIVYAEMFKEHGVNYTNEFFTKFLNITESEILVNSENTMNLSAITDKGRILKDQDEIVELKNPNEKIVKVFLDNKEYYDDLNPKIIDNLNNADVIILSSGTQWCSLIPSYMNPQIQECLKKNGKKIIFVINLKEDYDMYGCSSIELIDSVSHYVDLSQGKILYNSDANENLKKIHPKYKYHIASMKNISGKHDPHLLAVNIFKMALNLENTKTKNVFLDFDDTIYSRNEKDIDISIENSLLLNKLANDGFNFTILSGNTYKHIHEKWSKIFGANLKYLSKNIKIWADWCLLKYDNGQIIKKIQNKNIIDYDIIKKYLMEIGIQEHEIILKGTKDYLTSINIKPLNNREREFLSRLLNYKFPQYNSLIAGTTSVDIVSKDSSKVNALKDDIETYNITDFIFIGDECDNGNDTEIYQYCQKLTQSNPIQVRNVYETNMILQILGE